MKTFIISYDSIAAIDKSLINYKRMKILIKTIV